jgi:hypothetical protein
MSFADDMFWKEWHIREKQLKKKQPKCICGHKHPEDTAHYASCPYLIFWNEKFMEFKDNWHRTKSLVEFVW